MPNEGRTARRVALFFIAAFALLTVILGLAVHFVSSRAVERQLDAQLAREAGSLVALARHDGIGELETSIRERETRGVNPFGYLVRGADGNTIVGDLRLPSEILGTREVRAREADGLDHNVRVLTRPLPSGARLIIAIEAGATDALHFPLVALFGGSLAVMLGIGVFGGMLFDHSIRRRLGRMNDSARAIIDGKLDTRIAISSQDDEFDRLGSTLNTMLDRIDALIGNLRRVSSDIGHDLRTPLNRLRRRLDRMRAASKGDEQMAADVDAAVDEIDAMLKLFAALMRISEVESGALRRYFAPVDLSERLELLGESYVAAAEDAGMTMRFEIEPGICVIGDLDLLTQAVVNLLENALRYGNAGGHVSLELAAASDRVRISVVDNGPGISADDRAQVVQRFTRLEKGRSSPGFGLGLNLVTAIAEVHSGKLTLDDARPGLRADLELPAIVRLRRNDTPTH
jgi:signal transduction histidine kinase